MNIDQVIAKYVLGKQSKAELDHLELWKKETEDNLNALKQMKDIWSESDILLGYQDFNTEEAYDKWERDIKQHSSKKVADTKKIRSVGLKSLIGIAASLLLVLAIGNFYFNNEVAPTRYSSADAVQSIHLEDGTLISLKEKSNMIHSIVSGDQIIDLNGEAFFNVAKQKDSQFLINTNQGTVKVIGTRFTVFNLVNSTTIAVQEGIVSYTSGDEIFKLLQGDQLIHDKGGIHLSKVNEINIGSWVSKKLVFNNVQASQVFKEIESHFGIRFMYKNAHNTSYTCAVSATFENQTIDQILKELSLTIGLEFHKSKETYVIDDVKC